MNPIQNAKFQNVLDTLDKIQNGYNDGLIHGIVHHLNDIVNDEDTCSCLRCKDQKYILNMEKEKFYKFRQMEMEKN